MKKQGISAELRILSIGNSFSVDTMEHLANVALHSGVSRVKLGNLYVGGCSIKRHYTNVMADASAYKYCTNNGAGWEATPDVSVRAAVESEDWDWISIQHGTGDGSRYTDPESYVQLPALIAYVKALAPRARIAFNMAWAMEPDHRHHEIRSYNGDQLSLYRDLSTLTRELILPMEGIDAVSPVGTAVQNARTATATLLTRDGFHLSYGLGRYLAALTFLGALTGAEIKDILWMPEGVSETEGALAIAAAQAALKQPFAVTDLT